MMQFWLSFNNNAERLQLPVNPEAINIGYGQSYDDITVKGLGDYTVIGDPQGVTFSFSSFFPSEYDESYCEYPDIPNPWDVVQQINGWKESGKPLRLTVTGTSINYAVTIRSFDIFETHGAVGDLYYSLSFREYKFITPKTVDVSQPVVKNKTERPPAEKPTTSGKVYVVKSGDSLYKIAKKYGTTWQALYNKNKTVIGGNPNLIKPGQKLTLP